MVYKKLIVSNLWLSGGRGRKGKAIWKYVEYRMEHHRMMMILLLMMMMVYG